MSIGLEIVERVWKKCWVKKRTDPAKTEAVLSGSLLAIKQKMIGLITTEKLTYANGNYRTMNLNPAIALFSANFEQNSTKANRTDPAKTEAVL